MNIEETSKPAKVTSSRKVEANRRNAQHSTGPQTPEGKMNSSQNSITHGIFVKKFLNGATPETVADLETLVAGIRAHYQPVGMLEEILMQKIVVEAARYDRVLGFEHQQLTRDHAFHLSAVDRIDRYATSTSRALFRAIEELERSQAARKAVKRADDSSQETAPRDAKPEEEQRSPQCRNDNPSKSSTPTDAAGDVAA
jgi:hypothetical protein